MNFDAAASPSRHGTKFYTSTTRSTFKKVDAVLFQRPCTAAPFESCTNRIGRCGPGKDLPSHYLSSQRQSYSRPQSASFIYNSRVNASAGSSSRSAMTSASTSVASVSCGSSSLSSTTRGSCARVDPRLAWYGSNATQSCNLPSVPQFRRSTVVSSSSIFGDKREPVVLPESAHPPRISMSSAPHSFKLRDY